MSDSYVEIAPSHTAYVGPDATKLFAAASLRSAIALYLKTGIKASRMHTPSAMRAAARSYTGKSYASRDGLTRAESDLRVWIEAMKSALPVTVRGAE